MQESIGHLCHCSQAFLSTAARCTVLFLNPVQSSLMILCHVTVLLLSCNVLVVTLTFHYFLLQSWEDQSSLSSTCLHLAHSFGLTMPSKWDSPICHPYLSELLSTVDVGMIQICLCKHLRLLPHLDPYPASYLKKQLALQIPITWMPA